MLLPLFVCPQYGQNFSCPLKGCPQFKHSGLLILATLFLVFVNLIIWVLQVEMLGYGH